MLIGTTPVFAEGIDTNDPIVILSRLCSEYQLTKAEFISLRGAQHMKGDTDKGCLTTKKESQIGECKEIILAVRKKEGVCSSWFT